MPPTPPEARIVLALFCLRWLGGIAENFGVSRLSEITAMVMLAGLAILFLLRMRLAQNSALFLAGLCAWFLAGSLSHLANPLADATETTALLVLLVLYGLFTNSAVTFLQHPGVLTTLYRLMAGFITVGFGLSVLQIATSTGFVETGRDTVQRAIGSDVHPVSFAIQIVAAGVALEILRAKSGRPPGIMHFGLLLVGGLALYLTLARTAWVMALITILYVFLARGRPLHRLLGIAIAAGVGTGILVFSDRFADLSSLPVFLANFSPGDGAFDWRFVDNSVSWRIVNWTLGFTQAMEHPLLGFGPGQSASSSYFNLEMHNIFLEALFEGGLFGLLALLITLAGLVRLHRHLPQGTPPDGYARALINGFGLSLLLAVTFSTSFVDQLMSFLIYILAVSAAGVPTRKVAQTATTTSPHNSQPRTNLTAW